MNKLAISILSVVTILFLSGCKMGKSKSKGLKADGQLYGVAPASKYSLPKPPGMVYIPSGTFHMGPSDEDVNFTYTARNKQISINGFWMDATEVTNAQFQQFVEATGYVTTAERAPDHCGGQANSRRQSWPPTVA